MANDKNQAVVMMTKEFWLASQLSVAKYSGGCRAWGHDYRVIPQTYDLLRTDFIPHYERLGRERFIELLKAHPSEPDTALKCIMQEEIRQSKSKPASANIPTEGDLFADSRKPGMLTYEDAPQPVISRQTDREGRIVVSREQMQRLKEHITRTKE